MKNEASKIVDYAVDQINELLPVGEELPKNRETVLLGNGGRLDSMGFVNLLAGLEEGLEKQFGKSTAFADASLLEAGESGITTLGDIEMVVLKIISNQKV